ncbi:tenascin [Drosophila hydei]|uniref:Tenascin n=1 Tax=Drosophila hydei TaxID=7224 RepID=A0A6J1LR15_DROHY|nr:tenascin [Drosophila hydei]
MLTAPVGINYFALTTGLILYFVYPLFAASLDLSESKACVEGTVVSYPQDCSRYFQCLNGRILTQSCPTESYFDPAWEVCVIDLTGICGAAATQCTESQIDVIPGNSCGYALCVNGRFKEVKCQLGSYFNPTQKICEIDEYGICSVPFGKCVEGELEEDPKDCAGYFRCVDGNITEQKCAKGSFFNADLKICEIDENWICVPTDEKCEEGSLKEDPEDCAGYLKCVKGNLIEEKCAKGSFFNADLKICEIDENGICVPKDEKCVEGSIKEDPENCAGYLKCVNERFVEEQCAKGSFFNTDLKICEIDEDGICISKKAKCTEGSLEEDPDDCSGYLRCVNGRLIEEKCAKGSLFNADLKICEIDEDGICNPKDVKCTDGSLEEDPKDCAGYLKCVKGNFIEEKCAKGSFFNIDIKICEIDENGICVPSDEKCEEGSLEEDPEDCAGYLKCVKGNLIEERCAKGSFFNADLKICEIDDNGICIPKDDKCTEGSLEEDPEDCAGYLKCVNERFVEEKCAKGSFFNTDLKICEIDASGFCIRMRDKCFENEVEANPENKCGYLRCANGNFEEFICAGGRYYNSTLETCVLDENGVCAGAGQCENNELRIDPDDCAGYLQCIDGKLVKRLCSHGSYYHRTMLSCVVDDDGVCTPLSDRCEEGERETDPDDCASYLECVDGDFVPQNCVSGSYFDAGIKDCLVDEYGVCIA